MAVFAGQAAAGILPTRLREIRYATAGMPFSHATQAGNFGLREDAFITAKAIGPTDTAGRLIPDTYEVTVEQKGLQTNMAALKNALLLSVGPHQLRVRDQSGNYFGFINNTASIGAPDGSANVGLDVKYSIGQTDRTLDLKWMAKLSPAEWKWVCENVATVHTGASGGSVDGRFTAMAYSRAGFRPSNFNMVKINSVDVGFVVDVKIDLEVDGRKDNRERRLGQNVKVTAEATLLQTRPTIEMAATIDQADIDSVIEFNSWAGENWKFLAGAINGTGETKVGDKENQIKITFGGVIPLSVGAGLAIDMGDTTPDEAVFTLIGYN
jgi:hypothetical protein